MFKREPANTVTASEEHGASGIIASRCGLKGEFARFMEFSTGCCAVVHLRQMLHCVTCCHLFMGLLAYCAGARSLDGYERMGPTQAFCGQLREILRRCAARTKQSPVAISRAATVFTN